VHEAEAHRRLPLDRHVSAERTDLTPAGEQDTEPFLVPIVMFADPVLRQLPFGCSQHAAVRVDHTPARGDQSAQ
jgi:hypothetical protein